MTSLRLPPVSDTASGVPWPSVSTWCFEPVGARSTGLGPVFGPPLSARTWELSITARDQSSFPAACNSASSTWCSRSRTRPHATRPACASKSCPTRSPVPWAGTPTASRCAARTRSRTAPSGHPTAYARDSGYAAPPSATAARSAPTSYRPRSTEDPHPSSRRSSNLAADSSEPQVIIQLGALMTVCGPWEILLGRRHRRTRCAAASRGGCPSTADDKGEGGYPLLPILNI